MEKMSRSDRAKQFMPFAALRGYDNVVKEKERIVCEKKELTDEQIENLNNIVSVLKKGDVVKIVYYKVDAYVTITGVITSIDTVMRYISVIKTKIDFLDILSIDILE